MSCIIRAEGTIEVENRGTTPRGASSIAITRVPGALSRLHPVHPATAQSASERIRKGRPMPAALLLRGCRFVESRTKSTRADLPVYFAPVYFALFYFALF